MATTNQLTGAAAIAAALDRGSPRVTLILARKGGLEPHASAVLERARALGIRVRFESAADLWRMARDGGRAALLGLTGRDPDAPLEEVLAGAGPVWLLAGASYPGNAGFVIRTVEVAAAAGIVLDGPFDRKMKRQALRVSMRADRFMPVFWQKALPTIEVARGVGRRIVALEDSGRGALWETDLTAPVLMIVGGERGGIPTAVLDQADAVVRIPMPGFIGSYNLQAAASMGCAELLRQAARLPPRPPVT